MAAMKENLLSLGHLNSSEKNTFNKQRQFCGNKSVNMPVLLQDDSSALHSQEHLVMHLQQRWQELKEREYTAQQQNRQLLQQFEKAQDTLKEMLARNAAMKIIRMEYERYLEENSPRWQQQLKEKTQAAQKKKLDDYLSSCLKNAEVMKSSAGPPTKPQKTIPTPKGYSDYNQDSSSDLLHTQSSWLTHSQSQTARFPTRVPQSFLQPPIIPHPYPLHYPASTPGHYHPWPRQDLQSWAFPHPDYPWSQPAGAAGTPSYSEALWGQLCVEEPSRDSRVSQTVGEENKMSRALSKQRERSLRSSSSHLSHELDVKPVRLSSSHGESSESDGGSSVASGEKRKETGGKKQCASSDSERRSSQELSGTSGAIPVPSLAVAQSSESNASSEKSSRSSSRRTKRSGELSVQSPRSEKVAEEKTRGKGDDSESQHTGEESGSSSEAYKSEKVGTQNHEDKSDRSKESGSQREKESESENVKNENNDAGEVKEQESSSSEQSSTEEKVEDERERNLEAEEDEEKENSQTDKEQDDSDMEQGGDDVSAKKEATGEEADTSIEDEMEEQEGKEQPTRLKSEGTENRKQGSASSEDEEEGSEASEEEENEESNEQEDGESEKEEEHRSEEDEIDSDDCIITMQEKRSKQMQISEEAAQEEEEGKTGSCNDDSNEVSDEDDVENLLAPQKQTQKKETDLKAQEKPNGSFHNMGIFQVEHDGSKTEDPNDSDEFDHFYD
ncbi:uncharacterized protein DDB_G0290685 isoform X2 [Archocentrus centrarchus]|uniref:uncharacterized protein DDB_G0290685 isoform X2 n=1 Tax=Archocentrus centrarchus TaxID=63155 RepID=UPI0011E9E7FB|nr:uncharacterized protein DDB_G0290685-like isoform X2 [Archocentrus centrarchus]